MTGLCSQLTNENLVLVGMQRLPGGLNIIDVPLILRE